MTFKIPMSSPDLTDAERQFEPRAVEDIAEVDENPLCRFGSEVRDVFLRLDCSNIGLKHEGE